MIAAAGVPPDGPVSGPGKVGGPDAGASVSALPDPVASEVITNPSKRPFAAHGRLFYKLNGVEYSCSATVVDSKKRRVVATAGHCVFGSEDEINDRNWATDVVFVPAYRNGTAPLGQYHATWLATTSGWNTAADYRYDFAAVTLDQPVQNLTGARRIEFAANPAGSRVELFGYPAEPAPQFDGENLIRCVPAELGFDNGVAPNPYMARPCLMEEGTSGGGWIKDNRYLFSVVSYGYCQPVCDQRLFGPQLGAEAAGVYNSPNVGGSADPVVKWIKGPPRKLRRRSFNLRVGGSGSTPILFKVWLDRKPPVYTGQTIKIRRLSLGSHTVRVRSADQTGHLSPGTIRRTFRVLPKKVKKRNLRR